MPDFDAHSAQNWAFSLIVNYTDFFDVFFFAFLEKKRI